MEARRNEAEVGNVEHFSDGSRRLAHNRHIQTTHEIAADQADYSNPSLRIFELAERVAPPKNHGELIQLMSLNSTDDVTVITEPAGAVAGLGETTTETSGTATLVV